MTAWTPDELTRIGRAEELQVASRRTDGTLRPFVTIWVVRVGDDICVRSAYGPGNPWFVRAQASGTGRIRAGGVERDVAFVTLNARADAADADAHAAIDAAYHAKYDRYGPTIVNTVVGPLVTATTLRLIPTD
ncbi:DUF2255 family protein [Leifsonia kafniensis]|uniref:DUF2255 family protein n=1 Tax=Leifsonia kafniensis TaxID=475957 RepID=A0ABP7KK31_9MICO